MIAEPSGASRSVRWLLIGVTGAMLVLHGAGWVAAASVFWQQATLHAPRIQSAIVIGLALLVLRAASAPRRRRRLVVPCVLVVAAVAFVAAPLPKQFEGESLMPGGNDTGRSRGQFENRFRVGEGDVLFHSHLGDVVITTLDGAFGRSETSPARAYDALSRLAGLLFLLELGIAAAWHKWSRQSCRYVGLAMATPLCLLFFGYWISAISAWPWVSCRCWPWPEAGCPCGPKPGHWSRGVYRGCTRRCTGSACWALPGAHWPRSVAEATRFVDACVPRPSRRRRSHCISGGSSSM